ncbi:MAG: hypothetical protein LLG04_02110 [Parachlamydia sp.]|nr:hypothetical protein [Parachlamydia sp.]
MVTILPTKTNLGSTIGNALGSAGGTLLGNEMGYNRDFDREQKMQSLKSSQLQQALYGAEQSLSDPNLNDIQKQTGLFQALSSRPDIAKVLFDQYSQQKSKEKQMQQSQELLRGLEKQRGLKEGSLSQFASDPKLAAMVTKPQPERVPPGGVTAQPVPPEVSQQINTIIQDNLDANSDQLKMKLDQAGIAPIYSNGFVENRRRQDEANAKIKEKRIETGNKRADKVLEEADKVRGTVPLKRASLNAMKDAIQEGDMSFVSLDNLAELTGIEGFRTAKGGQFKTASKNFFINTLQKSGARPNQFLEKQIADGLPKIGRSREGNMIGAELAEFEIDVEEKRLEILDELTDSYEKSLGYVPGSIGRDVDRSMKKYLDDRQEQLGQRLKFLNEQEQQSSKKPSQQILMKAPDGSELMVPENEVEEALKLGAKRS